MPPPLTNLASTVSGGPVFVPCYVTLPPLQIYIAHSVTLGLKGIRHKINHCRVNIHFHSQNQQSRLLYANALVSDLFTLCRSLRMEEPVPLVLVK